MTTFPVQILILRRSDGNAIDAAVEAPFSEDHAGGRGSCGLGSEGGDGEALFVKMTLKLSVFLFLVDLGTLYVNGGLLFRLLNAHSVSVRTITHVSLIFSPVLCCYKRQSGRE